MNLRMTADEESMLKECSRILRTTKTAVVVEGIKKVYSELKKQNTVPYQSFSVLQSNQRYSPLMEYLNMREEYLQVFGGDFS